MDRNASFPVTPSIHPPAPIKSLVVHPSFGHILTNITLKNFAKITSKENDKRVQNFLK